MRQTQTLNPSPNPCKTLKLALTLSVTLALTPTQGQSGDAFIRVLPTLSIEYYNPKAAHLKAEFAQQIAALSTPTDDPVYMELHSKYVSQLLFDYETRASSKLFRVAAIRVAAIQFVRSYTASRHCAGKLPASQYFATPAPVFFMYLRK